MSPPGSTTTPVPCRSRPALDALRACTTVWTWTRTTAPRISALLTAFSASGSGAGGAADTGVPTSAAQRHSAPKVSAPKEQGERRPTGARGTPRRGSSPAANRRSARRIAVRYFVIVRRATQRPCPASSRASCASDSGSRGLSLAISSLQHRADRGRRAGAAVLGGQLARAELLEPEEPPRGCHVLAVGHATHRRLVQAELGRDVPSARSGFIATSP